MSWLHWHNETCECIMHVFAADLTVLNLCQTFRKEVLNFANVWPKRAFFAILLLTYSHCSRITKRLVYLFSLRDTACIPRHSSTKSAFQKRCVVKKKVACRHCATLNVQKCTKSVREVNKSYNLIHKSVSKLHFFKIDFTMSEVTKRTLFYTVLWSGRTHQVHGETTLWYSVVWRVYGWFVLLVNTSAANNALHSGQKREVERAKSMNSASSRAKTQKYATSSHSSVHGHFIKQYLVNGKKNTAVLWKCTKVYKTIHLATALRRSHCCWSRRSEQQQQRQTKEVTSAAASGGTVLAAPGRCHQSGSLPHNW